MVSSVIDEGLMGRHPQLAVTGHIKSRHHYLAYANRPLVNRILDSVSRTDTVPINTDEGFTSTGAVVLCDRRGTAKAEIPGQTPRDSAAAAIRLSSTSPRVPRPSVLPRLGSFTDWTFADVNAIASGVANIQVRLYQIQGNDHEELDDYPPRIAPSEAIFH
jgi:hypothetical protein